MARRLIGAWPWSVAIFALCCARQAAGPAGWRTGGGDGCISMWRRSRRTTPTSCSSAPSCRGRSRWRRRSMRRAGSTPRRSASSTRSARARRSSCSASAPATRRAAERRLQGHRAQYPRHRRIRRQSGGRGDRRAHECLRRRFPERVGELEHADLHPIASVGVRPPRIAESPVSFECKRITGLSLGPRSTLEVGRVIHIHIRDDLVDPRALSMSRPTRCA